MLDCKDRHWASQKAAQMGISEVLLNFALYAVDKLRTPVLYGLPSERPDARDFAITRFDPAILLSPHLQAVFSGSSSNAVKMAGSIPLYFRGSRGAASFHSIPVGALILDEVDKMEDQAVREGIERLSGQIDFWIRQASTPSVPGEGVSRTFEISTQDFFTFQCPRCSRWTDLSFPECLVITTDDVRSRAIENSHLICKECKGRIEHLEKPEIFATAKWEPKFKDRNIRGFNISQLYSCTLHPWRLAEAYLYSLSNQADEQVFYNSKLGLAHCVEGASINEEHIKAAMAPYPNRDKAKSSIVTMGIDVGKDIHFKFIEYKFHPRATDPNSDAEARVLYYDKIPAGEPGFPELHQFVREYNPIAICIDIAPERISSEKFVKQYPGRAFTVNYNEQTAGRSLAQGAELHNLTVNRTFWIDQYLGRYSNKTIKIPAHVTEELRVHLKSLKKMYEKDRNGEVIARYIKAEGRTDLAHCGVYCEIALRKAFESGYLGNIKVVI